MPDHRGFAPGLQGNARVREARVWRKGDRDTVFAKTERARHPGKPRNAP
jgi:hypothetical protein